MFDFLARRIFIGQLSDCQHLKEDNATCSSYALHFLEMSELNPIENATQIEKYGEVKVIFHALFPLALYGDDPSALSSGHFSM
jgi:hypothetical protein